MRMDEAKSWKCGSGHAMGLVVRDGGGVRRLLLYRLAVDGSQLTADNEVEVMAIIEGYVADVRCSICGRVRTWVPGEEALARLLERANIHHRDAEITEKSKG